MSKLTAVVQTCTGDLSASKSYYQKLDFELLSEDKSTLFTDGKFLLEINDKFIKRIKVVEIGRAVKI